MMNMSYDTLRTINTAEKLIAINDALTNWRKDAFSLSEINHLLSDYYTPNDFNAFDIITNYNTLKKAVAAAKRAVADVDAPWLKIDCECGGHITLTHRETLWYQKTGFNLPVFCPECMERMLGGVEA